MPKRKPVRKVRGLSKRAKMNELVNTEMLEKYTQ